MECEILRSPMISYQSLLNSTTVLFDMYKLYHTTSGISLLLHDAEARRSRGRV